MTCSRLVIAAAAAAVLSGCAIIGGSGTPVPGGGLVVGDEPEAVQAGADVLAHGGNAADAVTATYFSLAVTYPVAAGLGGGGLCIVYDSTTQKAEAVDFLARDAAHGGRYAVPGNVSGFSYLQATYGRLPWQRLISPAEGAAAAGFPISQALATRLDDSQDVIRLDASLSGEFMNESGHVKPAGTQITAPDLAQTLTLIRTLGPEGFYRGQVANGIVAYANSEGGALSAAGLAAYRPQREAPAIAHIGNQTVFLPPSQTGAGRFAGGLLSRLVDSQGQVSAKGGLGALVAAATKATLDAYHLAALPRDLGATGFAAEDPGGMAVACAVTMNGPFGSGHTATGTGVTLAAAPDASQAGLAAAFLTPVIAVSDNIFTLAGAGAGGPNGTAGIALALLKLAQGQDVTAPHALPPTGIEPYDTVNVIGCQNGICTAMPDPGAHGLGAAAGSP
jgi:gamma-glutamyltranspeptidase / glutathione hydrolase